MEDLSSNSPLPRTFNGMWMFPLTKMVIDGTSEVWPTLGRPMIVFWVLKRDEQGAFVEIHQVPRSIVEVDKVELLKRFYLHQTQIMKVGPKLQMWTVDESNDSDGHFKTVSFGLQFSLQRANELFHTTIMEYKSNATKLERDSLAEHGEKLFVVVHPQVDIASTKHVHAMEASDMAEYACKLVLGNHPLNQRITTTSSAVQLRGLIFLQVVHGKIEEVELPKKANIIIFEPMGTLLVNEQMLESYIIARDKFLLPNGKMFPSRGSDKYLYGEIANKPVVDAFDPKLLIAQLIGHNIDFLSVKEEDLYKIDVFLEFKSVVVARVHSLACWFDVLFDGRFKMWSAANIQCEVGFERTVLQYDAILYMQVFSARTTVEEFPAKQGAVVVMPFSTESGASATLHL